MPIESLETVDAFIVFDLANAPEAVGIVRSARKILPSGAGDLARSMTYALATFEMRRSGASAGINALDEDRADAVAKFTSEISPMVASGRFLPEPGTRVPRAALASLAEADSRAAVGDVADQAVVAGVVAAAATAAGGLDGRTVAIEGFNGTGPALAAAVAEQGAKVVAVTSGPRGAIDRGGFPAGSLSTPGSIPNRDKTANEALAEPVDVLFAGSKMGAVNHTMAGQLSVGAVVPHAPIPVTARALAILGRAGTTVVPDFISTAGALFAWWPTGEFSPEAIAGDAAAKIAASLEEISAHPDGLFLAAAQRAETFLATWQDPLPFGRPLAP
ncbi:hypothetical protein [Candidatus Poriferisocius sp.]|uniref:hypothetical protein n=1 Tax=Candidatus Poriferisocius sp. TaxID=3101276 RepID=UPI003B01D0DC